MDTTNLDDILENSGVVGDSGDIRWPLIRSVGDVHVVDKKGRPFFVVGSSYSGMSGVAYEDSGKGKLLTYLLENKGTVLTAPQLSEVTGLAESGVYFGAVYWRNHLQRDSTTFRLLISGSNKKMRCMMYQGSFEKGDVPLQGRL